MRADRGGRIPHEADSRLRNNVTMPINLSYNLNNIIPTLEFKSPHGLSRTWERQRWLWTDSNWPTGP